MNIKEAIGELSCLLKHQSDGYYTYLVNGGKNYDDMERTLEALEFAIKFLQNAENKQSKQDAGKAD